MAFIKKSAFCILLFYKNIFHLHGLVVEEAEKSQLL